MENINSKDNQYVKTFVKLTNSKSHREELGLFAIEGLKLVVEAFNNCIKIETVFVTASCLEKRSQELEKLFQTVNAVIISDEICRKLTDQKSPQGIFAICKIPQKPLALEKIYTAGKYVFLCDLQDAGNVGTIVRCAEATGFDGVIVSSKTCDLFNPKVIRATMGSIFRMKTMVVFDSNDFVDKLNSNGVSTLASVIDDDACDVLNLAKSCSTVLLIGNEGNGLDIQLSSRCCERITIKMRGNSESLNAAMAACILMWEISK